MVVVQRFDIFKSQTICKQRTFNQQCKMSMRFIRKKKLQELNCEWGVNLLWQN